MLIIVQRIFPIYRKFFFDKLFKIQPFILVHGRNSGLIKQVNTVYSKRVFSFNLLRKETTVFLNILSIFFKHSPKIVIHEFALCMPSLFISLIFQKVRGKKFVIWGHGYDKKKGFNPSRSVLDYLRLKCLQWSDAIILYDSDTRNSLSSFLDKKKMFVANNTLDTDYLLKIRDQIRKEKIQFLRQKHKFKYKYNLRYIGRLIPHKWPKLIVNVFEELPLETRNITGVHIIGDGPEEKEMIDLVKHKGFEENIKFYGSIHDERILGELLWLSDLLINPGYIGLSVVHAFCFGCPVVTFEQTESGPYHSPEIINVIHNETGYRIRDLDVKLMAETILFQLLNENISRGIKLKVQEYVKNNLQVKFMIEGFTSAIKFLDENPSNS